MKKLLLLFLLLTSVGWCAGPDILDSYRPVPLTDFLLGNSPSYRTGRMFWDTTNVCPAYYPDVNGPIHQIGQESWIRAFNNTGAPILNGQAVVISSAIAGVVPTASLAQANATSTADVIAVCTYDVAAGAFGYFTTLGVVRDVNTIAWSAGTDLYLSASTAGSWTSTIPTSPNYVVQIGRVITSAVEGAVYVRPHIHGSMTRAQFAAGINLGTALAIADGGTGQTASSAALTALGGVGASGSGVASTAFLTALGVTSNFHSDYYAANVDSGSNIVAVFSSEVGDPLNEFNPATGIFTTSAAGWYTFSASVVFNPSATGFVYAAIYVDGAAKAEFQAPNNATTGLQACVSLARFYIAAGKQVTLHVYQNSGSASVVQRMITGGRVQ